MTINQTIVYKVVRLDEEHTDEKGVHDLPYISSYVPKGYALTYKLDTWTHAPEDGGPIFAFASLKAAEYYKDCIAFYKTFYILKCEAVGVANKFHVYEKPRIRLDDSKTGDKLIPIIANFTSFRPSIFNTTRSKRSWIVPTNKLHFADTIVCEAVRPIEIAEQ